MHGPVPLRLSLSIETTTNNFSRLYSLEADKWDNVSTLAESLGWANIAAQNMSSYLESRGVSKPFISEIIDATIRLKHGQVCYAFLHYYGSTTAFS